MLEKAKPAPVPVFQLYGEAVPDEELSTLHVEALATRSGLHNWEIRPHRHDGLHQIFLVEEGRGEVVMDDLARAFAGPCLIAVPPLLVHGFRFQPDAQGHVVTVSARLVAQLGAVLGHAGLADLLEAPLILALGKGRPALTEAFEALAAEFRSPEPWRSNALAARLGLLLIEIGRAGPAPQDEVGASAAFALIRSFRALLELRVAEHWTVGDYADALSVTRARLNAVCQKFSGRSPMQIAHERLLVEAKRNLIHTAMSVTEISYALGFRDPAYFCRFFTRNEGCPPSAYRRRQASRGQAAP